MLRSKQREIELALEQAIRQGRWKNCVLLPPERELAQEFGVNRTTLRSALAALSGRGLLECQPGVGRKVLGQPAREYNSKNLAETIEALVLVAPALIQAVSLRIRPSQFLGLERLFPLAGAALRNGDIHSFVKAQNDFFTGTGLVLGNGPINELFAHCLPDAKKLAHNLSLCDPSEHEALFARLARILSAMRHAEATQARAATEEYFIFLKSLVEKR